MDKIYIGYSLLGELSTAPWGVIDYTTEFKLNEDLWRSKLRPAANEGANICRVLPFSLFGAPSPEAVFCPFKYDPIQKAWDLSQFNVQYFQQMLKAVQIAKSIGISIWLELFDNCGLWHEVQHLNPLTNNVQGVDALYGDNEYRQAYVAKMLNEFGDTVKWGLGNELTQNIYGNGNRFPLLPCIGERGLMPFSYGGDLDIHGEETHTSVMKKESLTVEELWGEDAKIYTFRQCHQACDPDSERVTKPVYWWKKFHSFALGDDGQFPRPDGVQWGKTVEYVLSNVPIEVSAFGQAGKARLLFECCPETPEPHLIIRSMITKCEEFGVSFENKGKYPEIIPEPPEPEKPKPGITWQGWLGIGLIVAAVIVALVLIF
jgi:hypothetical protein